MICRCSQCDWPIHTKRPVRIMCFRCGNDVVCGDESSAVSISGKSPSQLALKARIEQSVARDKRLRAWITFFRASGEIGLGDTIKRLTAISGKKAIKADLERLAKTCGCKPEDATKKLNEQYPY
jgi:hypothetical protein